MQLHTIQPKHRSKSKKRVGRGGKRGTYCGRGVKGQKARAGRKLQPIIRELIKRYPKLRGYRESGKFRTVAVVNLGLLEKHFQDGEKVTPEILLERGLIDKIKNRAPNVKVLGSGELTKKLTLDGCAVSKSAKQKIEKAGGKVNLTT